MTTEIDTLRREHERLRRIVEGERGDNGLSSRVLTLEIAQRRDDHDRDDRRSDWREVWRTLLILVLGGVLAKAGSFAIALFRG